MVASLVGTENSACARGPTVENTAKAAAAAVLVLLQALLAMRVIDLPLLVVRQNLVRW